MKRTKDALILAATKGVRMAPLTQFLPKCLLPIGEYPVIVRQLQGLEQCGVLRAHICIEETLGSMIEKSLGEGYTGPISLNFLYDRELKGIGYSTLRFRDTIKGDFIMTLADEYLTSSDFFSQLQDCSADFVVGLARYTDAAKICEGANVTFNADGSIQGMIEKPSSDQISSEWCWTGFARFSPAIFKILDDFKHKGFEGELDLTEPLNEAVRRGFSLQGIRESGYNVNLTTLEDYHEALSLERDIS